MDLLLPFFFLGSFKLLFIVWSDLKNLLVDERHSTFMLGVVIFMFGLTGRYFELLVFLLGSQFGLVWLKKQKWFSGVGAGDVSVLAWVFCGLWFFHWFYLVVFMLCYISLIGLHYAYTKKNNGYPLTIIIAISFIITWSLISIGLI